jgi:hypothetical protein
MCGRCGPGTNFERVFRWVRQLKDLGAGGRGEEKLSKEEGLASKVGEKLNKVLSTRCGRCCPRTAHHQEALRVGVEKYMRGKRRGAGFGWLFKHNLLVSCCCTLTTHSGEVFGGGGCNVLRQSEGAPGRGGHQWREVWHGQAPVDDTLFQHGTKDTCGDAAVQPQAHRPEAPQVSVGA